MQVERAVVLGAVLATGAVVATWVWHAGLRRPARSRPPSVLAARTERAVAAPVAERSRATAPVGGAFAGWRGVVVRGGLPVEGAVVRLCALVDHAGGCALALDSVETDARGQFAIARSARPSVAATGTEEKAAEAEPGGVVGGEAASVDEAETPRSPVGLVVEATESAPLLVDDARFVLAATPAGARLELPAGCAITGVVRDTNGAPLGGVAIGWARAEGRAAAAPLPFDGDGGSDAEGRFRLAPLPAGRLLVWARSDDAEVAPTVLPVELRDAETRELQITVGREPLLALRGRVVDRTGQPLALVQVTVDEEDPGAAVADRLLRDRATTSTDGDGRFTLPFATPGPHALTLHAYDADFAAPLAAATLRAAPTGDDARPATIATWVEGVRCTRDDGAAIGGYRVGYFGERAGGITGGSLGDDGTTTTVTLPWTPGLTSLEVSLDGSAEPVRLVDAHAPCRVSTASLGGRAFAQHQRRIVVDPIDIDLE